MNKTKLTKGTIIKMIIEDHEQELSVTNDNLIGKTMEVEVYGKIVDLNDNIVVIGNWVSKNDQDVYRILKKNIKQTKVLSK